MARRKQPWFTRLGPIPVDWSCWNRKTRKFRTFEPGEEWARYVSLFTQTEDGRELITNLTPEEARTLAKDLLARAEVVDRCNREQGDGWADDATKPNPYFR